MKLDELKTKRNNDDDTTRFLRKAIERKLNYNDPQAYDEFTKLFSGNLDPEVAAIMVASVENCINIVCNNAEFFNLIYAVASVPFSDNIKTASALVNFATSLSSISSNFNQLLFNMLFRELMKLAPTNVITEETTTIDEDLRLKLVSLIHAAIQTILKVSPMSGEICLSCFKSNYPYLTKETYLHKHAVKSILRLFSYAPVLRERGFTLLIEKLIAIDVEIRLDDAEEDKENPLVEAVASDSLSQKLDELLLLLFEYIEQQVKENDENAKVIFRILQKVFEKSIMLTHRSKYTQFLLFYICKFDVSFVERYVGRLVDWFCSEEAPTITRQTCSAYCASFICRANFVSIDIIRSVLYFSLGWINKYIDIYDSQENPLNPGDPGHLVFYSLTQAVCYIMCFACNRFEKETKGVSFIQSWDWTRILNSPLDPLRYCISSIASEFIRCCRRLDLLRVHEINSNYVQYLITSQINTASDHYEKEQSDIGSGYNPLDSFFPFDPYLLNDSSRYITPLYVNWSDITEDEESDDYDSVEEEEELISDSLSSLSMSIESHSFGSLINQLSNADVPSEEDKEKEPRQRKLSLSLIYAEGYTESLEPHVFESNPLSYANDDSGDDELKKLSFTRTRKMSDAGGW